MKVLILFAIILAVTINYGQTQDGIDTDDAYDDLAGDDDDGILSGLGGSRRGGVRVIRGPFGAAALIGRRHVLIRRPYRYTGTGFFDRFGVSRSSIGSGVGDYLDGIDGGSISGGSISGGSIGGGSIGGGSIGGISGLGRRVVRLPNGDILIRRSGGFRGLSGFSGSGLSGLSDLFGDGNGISGSFLGGVRSPFGSAIGGHWDGLGRGLSGLYRNRFGALFGGGLNDFSGASSARIIGPTIVQPLFARLTKASNDTVDIKKAVNAAKAKRRP